MLAEPETLLASSETESNAKTSSGDVHNVMSIVCHREDEQSEEEDEGPSGSVKRPKRC